MPIPNPSSNQNNRHTLRNYSRYGRLYRQRFHRLLVKSRPSYTSILRSYTYILLIPVAFSSFWILAMAYTQGVDVKNDAIKILPSGFNDLTAAVPLALAAMAGLFFSIQSSIENRNRKRVLGIAGRRMALASLYMISSFVLMIGSRIMNGKTFDKFRWANIFNSLAELNPLFMYINGAIALLFVMIAILRFIQAMLSDEQ